MSKGKRLLAAALTLILMLGQTGVSLAAPSVTGDKYTAYIGDKNHLYLTDNLTKATRVLPTAITDILSMTDTLLYCIASGGSLYSVNLDGSGSTQVAATPTKEQIDALRQTTPYTLENGALSILQNGTPYQIAPAFVVAATATHDTLYYAELTTQGIILKSYPLNQSNLQGALPAITTIGAAYMTPVALYSDGQKLVALDENGKAIIYNLATLELSLISLPDANIAAIFVVGDNLFCYTLDEVSGAFTYTKSVISAPPSPTPTATPTLVPTVTPRPTINSGNNDDSGSSSSDSTYTAVKYGQSNSRVRNMQNRLNKLSYPVGTVDGTFGDETLRALRLFQEQAGYAESTTASSGLLEKLYGSKAPEFDLYKSRKKGNTGERVRMMQERLITLKYALDKVDGIYGTKTAEAVSAFQQRAGIKVTGEATRETMQILYGSTAPANPTPTPAPTAAPTASPSTPPTGTPTDTPSPTPTESPTPTPEPTATPGILRQGDSGERVRLMKRVLADRGYLSADNPGDKFNANTTKAIEILQGLLDKEVTGTVDCELYLIIMDTANPIPTAPPTTEPGTEP